MSLIFKMVEMPWIFEMSKMSEMSERSDMS